jgi:hypothetical protein
MPYRVQAGQIQVGQNETFFVRASRGPNEELADSVQVTLTPGATTTATLFPPGQITATLVYPGGPTPFPLSQASATLAGTTLQIRTANSNTSTGVFTLSNLPEETWDVKIVTPGSAYRDTTITGVTVTPSVTTDLGTIVLSTSPEPAAGRTAALPPLPEEPEARHVVVGREGINSRDSSPGLASPFRAEGDAATVWRLAEDAQNRPRLEFTELFGSEFLMQHPAVTDDLGNGLRYVAYVGNDTGDWQLYVQRLENWVPVDDPVQVLTPGSNDNLSCTRTLFHPRWLAGGTGDLSLLVSLGDCPSNGFEDLGIDDNPWAVGEIRIWRVDLGPGF